MNNLANCTHSPRGILIVNLWHTILTQILPSASQQDPVSQGDVTHPGQALSTLLHIHDLTDTHDSLVSLWLPGKTVSMPRPPRHHSLLWKPNAALSKSPNLYSSRNVPGAVSGSGCTVRSSHFITLFRISYLIVFFLPHMGRCVPILSDLVINPPVYQSRGMMQVFESCLKCIPDYYSVHQTIRGTMKQNNTEDHNHPVADIVL